METIDITRTLYKVSDFLSWQRAGSLELSPNFQRRPVWSAGAKSYLIDTIARGLPVPIVFVRERTDLASLEPRREIVDGQQRIRTILSYIDPSCLRNYDENRDSFQVKETVNKDLAKKSFAQLSVDIKERILNYQFSVHILPSGTDDRLVLQIFARMNATGVKLNGQELRNARYFGLFKASMYQLAYEYLPQWRKWKVFSETNIARMLEVEATSDFAALIISSNFGLTQKSLDAVYQQNDERFANQAELEKRFRLTMESIEEVIGKQLADTAFKNRMLFHSLFALFYDLMFGLGSSLKRAKPEKLPAGLNTRLLRLSERFEGDHLPKEIAAALSGRTTHAGTRQSIFQFVKKSV